MPANNRMAKRPATCDSYLPGSRKRERERDTEGAGGVGLGAEELTGRRMAITPPIDLRVASLIPSFFPPARPPACLSDGRGFLPVWRKTNTVLAVDASDQDLRIFLKLTICHADSITRVRLFFGREELEMTNERC